MDRLGARLVPAAILVLCAGAFYLTTTFDRVPPILKRGIQPSDFPQLVIGLIALLALWLLLRDSDPAPPPVPRHAWATMGLLVLFPAVVAIDLFLALGLMAGALALFWGERRPWAIGLVSLASPAAIFFLFDQVFAIRFPRGLLTSLWYG